MMYDLFNEAPAVHPRYETLASHSPFNTKKCGGQNRRLLDYLLTGQHINSFSPNLKLLKVKYLNSRTSDLKNLHGINIEKKRITVKDSEGNECDCIDYYLSTEEINRIKNQYQ